MEYKLLKYTDKYHDEYIKSQVEIFCKCDVKVMEKHLEILKPNLKRIVVENETAGFVYFCEEKDRIVVDVLTILPEFRNQQLGSQILENFIKKSEKVKKPIYLDTFKTNPAQRFYKRHGFRIVDENKSHFILKYTPQSLEVNKFKTKKTKLKNGKTLTLTTPNIENAQEMADYRNTMVAQTRFVSVDIMDDKTNAESQAKLVEGTLHDEQFLIILAKVDGKIVGIGNIVPKQNNRVRYRHICQVGVSVLKDYWGLGIASAIMQGLVEFAKKTKFEQIELDVVSTNESAVHLYKKFGFVEEGRLTHAMKYIDGTYADCIKMQKFLV